MSKGKKNVYTCTCGVEMVTVDVEDGVTPFMTDCAECGKLMTSAFYAVDQSQEPTHEWYRPNPTERVEIAKTPNGVAMLRDHVDRGGLLLREIAK